MNGQMMFEKSVFGRMLTTQIVMMLMALVVLVVLALVAVNMLVMLAASWILLYGGVFFLGFGGSRWTSDIAINYFKTVLGVAAQLLTMVLIVAIGKQFLTHYYSQINATMATQELAVMLVVAVVLLALVNKVPPLISGIITGAGIGAGARIGNFGASAMGGAVGGAIGATGALAASARVAGSTAMAGAAQAVDGTAALMAAFSTNANSGIGASGDILAPAFDSGGRNGIDSGDQKPGRGETPLSKAAGFSRKTRGASGSPTFAQAATQSYDSKEQGSETGDDSSDRSESSAQEQSPPVPQSEEFTDISIQTAASSTEKDTALDAEAEIAAFVGKDST